MASNANTDLDKLITFGQMALEQGWYEQAREYFEQALVLDASNREAMKGLARVNEILDRRQVATVEPNGKPVEIQRRAAQKRKRPWWFWALVVVIGLFGCSIVTCLGILIFVVPSPKATPTATPAKPSLTSPVVTPTVTPVTPSLTSPVTTATPTPLPEGGTWTVDDLAITVLEHEVAGCYTSKYGSEICPPEGAVYLWVHLLRENRGDSSDLPIRSCFWICLFYRGVKLRPSLDGDHHPERVGWSGGGCGQLYFGKQDEGWVCFEVPAGIDLSEVILHVESYEGPKFEQRWRLRD
jgi:hypothetical protein